MTNALPPYHSGRPGQPVGRPAWDVDSLVRAAVEVFLEHGFDATSMSMVAAALGISKSSIYHHVPSKDALLQYALNRALDALAAVAEEPGAREGPAIQCIEYRIRRGVAILAHELPYVTLLLRVHGNTEVERAALKRRRALDAELTELMLKARAEGALRTDLDPRLATRLVFGALNSISEWYHRREGDEDEVARIADNLIRLMFNGLRVDRS